jgi:predicted O-methyltransferase YrrM
MNLSLANDNLETILKSNEIKALNVILIEDLMKFYKQAEPLEAIIKIDFSGGISSPNDYYFLCFLAKALNIKKYFEIGTWLGLSAYNMSLNTGQNTEIYTLDIPSNHPDLKLYNIPEEIFGFYSKGNSKIHHLKSDSKTFDKSKYKNQFELVFIDGNHSFDYVMNDTKVALELIKDDNSVIAWHDYILSGELNKSVLAGILEAIPKKEHKHIVHLYQSNLALYSKSFTFPAKELPSWYIAKNNFELLMKVKSQE